ncbi:MAG: tetrahydromethanopterin S-methyltransferase subunit F [Methanosarcinaceae archaeon]|jgi:tetrahydromethanopterin S-methyltransferase subunit F|nr:tetrahydromethanopterin S-methyltransferase subunit F [Methanosarcinaceae archaeon]
MTDKLEQGVPKITSPSISAIESTVDSIRGRGQLIARNQKLDSGVYSTNLLGFLIGFIIAIVFVIVIPIFIWGVM